MKAITIWQPWATLIVAGAKPYEFRGWPAHNSLVGQRIAIHAGARAVRKSEVAELIARLHSDQAWTTCLKKETALPILDRAHASPGSMPLASIVGTAVLGRPTLSNTILEEFGHTPNDSDRDEHCNWAWPMLEIKQVQPIVPMKGMQGFWDVPKGVLS